MLARYPHLLPLEAAEEGNVVVPSGVLATRLLALPFQDESRVAERGRLKEVVASGEWEEEGKMLRKIEGPVRETGARKNVRPSVPVQRTKLQNKPRNNHRLFQLPR